MSKHETLETSQRHFEGRNLQTDLEVILLALLSCNYSFVIVKPQKRSTVSRQFIKVQCINHEDFSFAFQKFVKQRGFQRIEMNKKEGISTKTANRRSQALKRREATHFFEDLLLEMGYFVEIEKESREGVFGNVNIFRNGKLMFNKQQIQSLSIDVWNYLINKLGEKSKESIEKGELSHFVNTVQ